MPRFRAISADTEVGKPLSLGEIRALLQDVFRPAHFFVAAQESIAWEHREARAVPWEIFRGRLVEGAFTTQRRTFETWDLYRIENGVRSAEPLLALKLDTQRGQVHVTRALLCHVWEGYHAGDNVYLSRETQKWLNELVASVDLNRYGDEASLRDQLIGRLFQAVVGVSRLPLTSVEAPLPDFTLGRLAYFHRPGVAASAEAITTTAELIEQALSVEQAPVEQARLLETLLRTTSAADLAAVAERFVERWHTLRRGPAEFLALLRLLFDEIALSPYTPFVERFLQFLERLVVQSFLSEVERIDFLSYLLRHLVRHLTAYDLITFHHQGANYPDALLLDALLKAYLELTGRFPDLFAAGNTDVQAANRCRLRRRALRQGWLLRRFYEGLPVPDAPTSPGENQRILPLPHVRVPDEQILDSAKRTRRLFADDPLSGCLNGPARALLRTSLRDLAEPRELRELGMAVFLDRPLGVFKAPTEPDQTTLFSCEAFSRRIARRRLDWLAREAAELVEAGDLADWNRRLATLEVKGIDLPFLRAAASPGKVSLDDIRKVSADFMILSTSEKSLHEFRGRFDFSALAARADVSYLEPGKRVVVLRGEEEGHIVIYDAERQRRLLLQVCAEGGYASDVAGEYPVEGLTVRTAWDASGTAIVEADVCLPAVGD